MLLLLTTGYDGLHLILGHLPETKPKALKALAVQSPNRLGQVTKAGRVLQVQCGTGVVSQHPWKDWPLQARMAESEGLQKHDWLQAAFLLQWHPQGAGSLLSTVSSAPCVKRMGSHSL